MGGLANTASRLGEAGNCDTLAQAGCSRCDPVVVALQLQNPPIHFVGWIDNRFTTSANDSPRNQENFLVFLNSLADQ